jgi:hypothetical protein
MKLLNDILTMLPASHHLRHSTDRCDREELKIKRQRGCRVNGTLAGSKRPARGQKGLLSGRAGACEPPAVIPRGRAFGLERLYDEVADDAERRALAQPSPQFSEPSHKVGIGALAGIALGLLARDVGPLALDPARFYHNDFDPEARDFVAQGVRVALERELGRMIPTAERARELPPDLGNIEDPAVALRPHVGQTKLNEARRPDQISL